MTSLKLSLLQSGMEMNVSKTRRIGREHSDPFSRRNPSQVHAERSSEGNSSVRQGKGGRPAIGTGIAFTTTGPEDQKLLEDSLADEIPGIPQMLPRGFSYGSKEDRFGEFRGSQAQNG
jgi:hypothetical protein